MNRGRGLIFCSWANRKRLDTGRDIAAKTCKEKGTERQRERIDSVYDTGSLNCHLPGDFTLHLPSITLTIKLRMICGSFVCEKVREKPCCAILLMNTCFLAFHTCYFVWYIASISSLCARKLFLSWLVTDPACPNGKPFLADHSIVFNCSSVIQCTLNKKVRIENDSLERNTFNWPTQQMH